MKKILIIIVTVAITLPAFAQKVSLNANDIVRIEISDEKSKSGKGAVKELRRRVRLLEKAVKQLQEQVYDLKYAGTVNTPKKTHTCFISTTFHGTVSGTASTLAAAKAKALKACDAKGAGLSCEPKNLKCD